jgi:hypothetical protein
VVEGGREQLSVFAPLLPLLAQFELVELLVGDEAFHCTLIEPTLLRRIGLVIAHRTRDHQSDRTGNNPAFGWGSHLEHCEDGSTLYDSAVELFKAILLLKVRRRAKDEDALALVHLRRARAALEIVHVEKGTATREALEEAHLDDAHTVLCGGPCVAQEKVEGLRVAASCRRKLHPLVVGDVLETTQRGIVLDLNDDLDASEHPRESKRSQHAADEREGESQARNDVIFLLLDTHCAGEKRERCVSECRGKGARAIESVLTHSLPAGPPSQ